ncbi:pentatricopeptide repeat-containing protein At2g34370, mitochondrial-like [Andrographis paniculata]|uniref:pentatricopeptide repeat-containing protein At2g34370, mitochondrial-like n=1 Tax=Andrographis paniculata TaxID=175694 RepID=UPI0021E81196|nr:pentatricopeptide repeat-containing protein At2g34370, mitochondrial-like [Andrographis paniculata]
MYAGRARAAPLYFNHLFNVRTIKPPQFPPTLSGCVRNLETAAERSDSYEESSTYNPNDRHPYGWNSNSSGGYGQHANSDSFDGGTGVRAGNPLNFYSGNHNAPFVGSNLGGGPERYRNGEKTPNVTAHHFPVLSDVEASQTRSELQELHELIAVGKLKEAVKHLEWLRSEGIEIDLSQYVALMKSCGEKWALDEAKAVHEHLSRSGLRLEVWTNNRILEMYSKCGSMEDALVVFNQMPKRNLTSWDVMICGLAENGCGEAAIELFTEFKRTSGLEPDGRMFIGVFSACAVVCDVVEGMLHFESMKNDYGIVPTMEHYVSIVGMMGSVGCLDEALEFVEKMPVEPGVEIWETLMKFCRIHGKTELGDRCLELIECLDASHVDEQSRAGLIAVNPSDIAREKEKKLSGDNGGRAMRGVHEYRAGDRSHSNSERIYELLWGLKQQLKEVGYVPQTKFVLHDIDEEMKEEAIMSHSERLAAAHVFLTTAARNPMRIIKNLRVCNDCHNVFKLISKLTGREIIMRDNKRYHHFREGSCSCNDYW